MNIAPVHVGIRLSKASASIVRVWKFLLVVMGLIITVSACAQKNITNEKKAAYEALYPYHDNDNTYVPAAPPAVSRKIRPSSSAPMHPSKPSQPQEPMDNDGYYTPPAGKPDPRDRVGQGLQKKGARSGYYYYYYYYPHDNESEVFGEHEENYIQPFFFDGNG
ncbi:MAG: hypothetical protein K0R63_191 [Rickettsiales bacterium]|nr:hypothetical protein [Rickettsiales bacterium]